MNPNFLAAPLDLRPHSFYSPAKTKTRAPPTAAVVLSGGRMPAQAELDLAAEARETLAAVARALPPRALLGGGGFKGVGGGAGGNEGGGRA